MKNSFKQLLIETFENDGTWNYYANGEIYRINPFKSTVESIEFIKKFITLSGKNAQELFNKINELDDRAVHVVSTFFLGVYIYENSDLIKCSIDNKMKKYRDNRRYKSDIKFCFIWFLICLFHDLGYSFEKNKNMTALMTF